MLFQSFKMDVVTSKSRREKDKGVIGLMGEQRKRKYVFQGDIETKWSDGPWLIFKLKINTNMSQGVNKSV